MRTRELIQGIVLLTVSLFWAYETFYYIHSVVS